MKRTLECLEISWEGPLTAEDIVKLNKSWDYGIYQIYGTHNIFGADSLLYIGKAMEQTFADRIVQHEHWIRWESVPVKIFIGRLGGTDHETIDDDTWDKMIDDSEKLLIYYSSPPYNSKNLHTYGDVKNTVIINHKCRHRLPFVVTTVENETDIDTDQWKVFGYMEE